MTAHGDVVMSRAQRLLTETGAIAGSRSIGNRTVELMRMRGQYLDTSELWRRRRDLGDRGLHPAFLDAWADDVHDIIDRNITPAKKALNVADALPS